MPAPKHVLRFDIRNDIADFFVWARYRLRQVIPADFVWVFEMDSDVGMHVHAKWTGHAGVRSVLRVSDCDFDIVESLLRAEDWEARRREAVASVEKHEAALLREAQRKRSMHLIGCPPVSEGEGQRNEAGQPDSPPAVGGTGLPDGLLQRLQPNAVPAASRQDLSES